MGRLKRHGIAVVMGLLFAPWPLQADMGIEQIRALTEAGELLPLEQVLGRLQGQAPGRAIEVEVERKHGRLIYEIEWLDEAGRVWEYTLDGRSGEVLERERD